MVLHILSILTCTMSVAFLICHKLSLWAPIRNLNLNNRLHRHAHMLTNWHPLSATIGQNVPFSLNAFTCGSGQWACIMIVWLYYGARWLCFVPSNLETIQCQFIVIRDKTPWIMNKQQFLGIYQALKHLYCNICNCADLNQSTLTTLTLCDRMDSVFLINSCE